MVAGGERVEGHLHRIERVAELEHLYMKSRILVAGKSNESHLPLFFCLIERFEHTAFGVSELRVVVVDDSMDLAKVEVIGAEPTQRLFEHLQSHLHAPSMSPDLGH